MVGFIGGIKFTIDLPPDAGEVSLLDAEFSIPGVFANKTLPELVADFFLSEDDESGEEFFDDWGTPNLESASLTQPNSDLTASPDVYFPGKAETILIDLLENPKIASFVNDILREIVVLQVDSGVTSVALDTDVLSSAAGLTLASTANTVPPVSDEFAVGFPIAEETNFTFSGIDGGVIPILGEIEHTGTVTFNSQLGPVTVGNFSIGFDESRVTENTSGFFVQDTAGPGAILFDVSNPGVAAVEGEALTIGDADLLVSQEFANFLQAQGLASADLTGADVGDVETNAIVKAVTADTIFA